MEPHKIEYSDFLINQKSLPDRESTYYKQFYDFHKECCINGVYIGDTYFTGWLYWHLNVWKTEVDVQEGKRIYQKYTNPQLRDNEWLVANEIQRAEDEKKGLVILGIRRFAKSVIAASYMSYGATFDENSQNIIAGLNQADIKLITDKIDKGLNILPEAWQWQRIEDNWKNQVTLGVKDKSGKRYPFSYIIVRNLDEGNNEEAIAGTKPRRLLIDEIGKGSFLKGLQAAIPGFSTPFGWGCSPILTGTGGDMKKFLDAKSLMFDVDKFNFLSYQNEKDSRRIHGLFIGAKYRMEAKEDSTMADFLHINDPLLKEIPIKVSNEEKALKMTRDEVEKRRKAGDRGAYLKEKMYYPIEVDEIFLNEDTNIYSVEAARMQQIRIKDYGWGGTPVELYHDGTKIVHKFTDKLPINEFPVKGGDKDAPPVIWEFPIQDPPYGLYVAGVDPYRQGKAAYSDSLGAVYIYKRMHDINSEKYQNMFVASYVARPDKQETWNETARLLIKYYNARTLCENDEMSFINYMISKNDAHYLEVQPAWLKAIVPNTTVNRDYGIHRSSEKIRDFLHTGLKKYSEEVLLQEKDESGSIIKEHIGMARIFDNMLLEEMINFNEDDNFDREVAASLAIALANHLDPIIGKVSQENIDPRFKSYFNKKKLKTGLFLPNNQSKLFS